MPTRISLPPAKVHLWERIPVFPGNRLTALSWFCLIFGLFLIVTPTGANDYFGYIPLTTVQQGVVSGGIYIDTYPGLAKNAEKQFYLPNYTSIQWARAYVGIYCGNMRVNYPLVAHINIDRDGDGTYEKNIGNEELNVAYSFPGDGGTGPVYVNDHVNRVTSDYLMWYDVKKEISGRNFGIRVNEDPINSTSTIFDGRIKFIALIVAYNDTDRDSVYYWVNEGHDAMQTGKDNGYTGETSFSSADISGTDDRDDIDADLYVLHLASEDGDYTFNSEELEDPVILARGPYFGEEKWSVTDYVKYDESNTLTYAEGEDATSSISSDGAYYKIPLTLLTITLPELPVGSLNVTSSPPGAMISLDDEETGQKTNTTLGGIETGDHLIRVSLPDGSPYKPIGPKEVSVTRNMRSDVHFEFRPIQGSIEIRSDPEGGWVYLDGKNQSVQTNTVLENVLAGEHTVSVKKTGYRKAEAAIPVAEGATATVALTLNASSSGESEGSTGVDEPIGYTGKNLTLYRHGVVMGGVVLSDASDYTGLLKKGDTKSYTVPVKLPDNATVDDARLYIYTTWSYNTATKMGVPVSMEVTQDDMTLDSSRVFTDRKGGNQTYDYPAETRVYSPDAGTVQNGTMTFTIRNTGESSEEFAVYGILLAVIYEVPGGNPVEYWITEGCDLVYAHPDFGITTANASTRAVFSGSIPRTQVTGAEFIAVSTAASGGTGDDNQLAFNDQIWKNALRGGSSGITRVSEDVQTSLLPEDNSASITSSIESSKGDYIENRNMILILRERPSGKEGGNVSLTSGNTTTDKESQSNALSEETVPVSSTVLPIITPGNSTSAGNSSHSTPVGDLENMFVPDSPAEEIVNQSNRSYDVRILSNPTGARISVDYAYSGKTTPDTIQSLKGGNHTITLELEQYGTTVERVFISDNQTLVYDLSSFGSIVSSGRKSDEDLLDSELYGGIYVNSMPPGATIYIDGKKTTQVTPNIVYGLKPGKHLVKVKLSGSDTGFPVESKTVIVDPGIITRVSFSEVEMPYFATPVINSTAYSGEIFTLNGQSPKYTFPAKVSLQVAANYLTIHANNSYLTLPVYPGLNLSTISVEPRKFTFRNLYVVSEPAGADIYIDGFPTGYTTPYLIQNLSDQEHLITVSKPGYVPLESLVFMSDRDQVRRFVLEEYLYGSLEVTSSPPGGKIYINNKDTGQITPFTFQYIKAGEYNVKVAANKKTKTALERMVEPFRITKIYLDLNETRA